ncbi:hypothetical protein FKR81_21465 [Lentzea tibetensis]|uniref:ATP-grasp domain-containing protein n=1 Tax=Lentzea tibetensis TaxID=2591470 RepID=A0A563ET11_9PSEU|nr:hypothetical protein [Lentzea tibetensis]TWP50274.1 hypothetical protein FKR81_21465 [Lentzea tibetensis]
MLYQGYNERAVAVVDALSSGHLYGPAFRARGVRVVHVRNHEANCGPQVGTFHGGDFVAALDYRGDVAATAAELAELGVRHVLAGTESGGDVADLLAVRLGLATANQDGFASARRDKRVMHQAVHQAGVPVPWQRHLGPDGGVVWETGGPLPGRVVVKPPASTGTDGVLVCSGDAETDAAVRDVLRASNAYGQRNDGAVVQEYLTGTEYMVNTVTVAGRHAVVEVWRSDKKVVDGRPIYDRQVLESPDDPAAVRIIGYVSRVLDALGVRWGAAHTELIDGAAGPLLLETGTRLPGGSDPSLALAALGTSHVDEVVESYLAPDTVAARGPVRPLRKRAWGVSLISPVTGNLRRPVDLRPIRALPSFHGMRVALGAGQRLTRTVDMFTKPGGLYLCHEDERQLSEDYAAVREWERVELPGAVDAA